MQQTNMQNTLTKSQNFPFNLSLGQGPKESGPTDCWSMLLWPCLTWWAGQVFLPEKYPDDFLIIGNRLSIHF